MEYFVKSGNPEKQRVGCVVVGVFDRRKTTIAAGTLDHVSAGAIGSVMRRGDMDGKLGQTLMLHNLPNMFCDRVLLVGMGKERDLDDANFRTACTTAAKTLKKCGAKDAVSYLTHANVKGRSHGWKVKQAALMTEAAFYSFTECRGEEARNNIDPPKIERITFDVPRRSDLDEGEVGLTEALGIAKGVATSRRLGDLPGNICTPTFLADHAQQLAKDYSKIKTRVLEEAEMEELGMGALLSVSRGSRQPAKLIIMEYMNGPKDQKPVIFVGKGLTFDAGGISIKPGPKMDEMKYDMCGGASVFGAMHALAELELPMNVVGIVPSSENLPDGDANKPGDIVTSMSGITIEVLNTDAESRLIHCDALTYAERNYDADVIVDMATLTGACVVALGAHATGLFSNQSSLAKALLNAGESIVDRAWEMPLWEDYQKQLKSPFADVANIGGPGAGAITAASFLHRFMRKQRWAHLDIAGTAWTSGGATKGSTGRPVGLLVQFLLDRLEKQQAA